MTESEDGTMSAKKKTIKGLTKLKSKTLGTNRALNKVFSVRSSPPTKISGDS